MRLSVRWLALTIGCAAFAIMVIAAGPRLWLRTSHGHRTVERVLTRILDERVPGVVSVGRLSGDVLTGLRADDVIVRNPDGAVIGRAQYIAARWRPLALLRRRELEEVHVERPVIAIDRARWLAAAKRSSSREVVIALIVARDGQLTWKHAVLTRVSGTATLYSRSHLDVHGVSGRVAGNVSRAFGVVGWGGEQTWVATRFAVARPGVMHARGQLFYTPGQLDGEIDEAELAAPVATRLVGGQGPLRLHGHVAGSLDELRSEVRAQQDARSLHLRVAIDGPRRRATIVARLAGAPRPIRLRARARYRPGTIVLSALHADVGGSRLDATGKLARQHVHAELRLRLLPSEARLFRLQPAAPLVAQLRADGRTRALAVRGHAQMEAAQLWWRGRVDLSSRAGALHLVARAFSPARLVRGPPPMRISGSADVAGRLARHALVASIRVERGSLDASGYRFTDIAADLPAASLGRDGMLRVRRLSGRWRSHRFDARGLLSWSRRRIAVSDAVLDCGGAHAEVDASYQLADRRITLRAAPLSVSPELLSRLLRRPFPRPWTGSVMLAGRRGDVTITVDASTIFGPLRVAARLLRSGRYIDLQHVEAWIRDSHLYGAAHYQDGRLSASVRELLLSPSLVHQLVPLLTPAWPIRIHGVVAGHQILRLSTELEAGPSTVRLGARIAGRQFRMAAHLDGFDLEVLRPSQRRVRATGNVFAVGHFDNGGVVGTLTLRDARGYILESPFFGGMADARLEGRGFVLMRAVARIPGAKLIAEGKGALGKGGRIDFGVVVVNALALRHVPQGLRTLVGINSMLPGRSVTGSITKRPGEKFQVSYRVLPIGLAQLELLFRVLTGRWRWSESPL